LGGGGALLIGTVAGFVSTVGYVFIMFALEEKIGLYDTCGVHNLHGMPGVLGGIASVISASFASELLYGDNIGDVFPAMVAGRSASDQAKAQFMALGVTLVFALVTGALTGGFLKMVNYCIFPFFDNFQ
jgi:ammonium transporter Rh